MLELLKKEDITSKIDLKCNNWENNLETNCYAFALGLDIRESNLVKYAYQPGSICESLTNLTDADIAVMNIENRMISDLKSLGIEVSERGLFDEIDENNEYLEWKIALLLHKADKSICYYGPYHFIRQASNGIWYHKIGYNEVPPMSIGSTDMIENTSSYYAGDYKYYKTYKLSIPRR
jgi:hypothetical protein